jgi:L-iditol 2-dehydrogenase
MVTAVDPDPGRRSRTGALAEAPAGAAFDVAVVAVGHPDAYRDALACLAPRGRLVVFSGLAPPDARQAVDLNQLHYHEQTLVGAYGCSLRHGAAAIALIAQRRVVVSDLVSHRLPLTELAAALRIVRERRGLKVLLYP